MILILMLNFAYGHVCTRRRGPKRLQAEVVQLLAMHLPQLRSDLPAQLGHQQVRFFLPRGASCHHGLRLWCAGWDLWVPRNGGRWMVK